MIVPVSEGQEQAPLRICVLVKVQPAPPGGSLVTLRSTLDGRIFLGCIADVSGKVHAWLEVRVQCPDVLRNTSLAARVFLSNAMLDDRWHRQAQAFEQMGMAETIRCGWETSNPLPTFLDVASLCPVHPKDERTGTYWQLCRDEAILHSRGLPPYSGSLYRYLHLPDSDAETALIPVTDGAPANDHTRPLSEVCPNCISLIPFNPAAGFMLITRHYPTDLESFIELLGGARQRPERNRSVVAIDVDRNSGPGNGWVVSYPGRLFLDAQGKCSRLVEALHLKLVLLSDIVASVHSVVRCLQQPFLDLSAESFRVELDNNSGPLPFLWTARARLVEPGHALAVHVGATDLTYHMSPLMGETSVYRPVVTSLPAKGRSLIRIRKVLLDSRNTVTVEGTLATQERIEAGTSDLVVMQLTLASGDLCLHAHLERDSALARDEFRFRTISHSLDAGRIHEIQSAQGVPMPEVPFEIIQPLSSPCDLYSLAILAVRTLLVDHGTSLPVAVDEMLSLARRIQAGYDPAEPLPLHVERVFRSDERWLQSLGPHRLTNEQITPEEALGLMPQDVWWSTLATIMRMFPGLGPVSLCRDYGDASPGGLHLAFEDTLTDLSELILKTRYLVASDAKSDTQIAAVIRRYLDGQAEQDSDPTTNHEHHE